GAGPRPPPILRIALDKIGSAPTLRPFHCSAMPNPPAAVLSQTLCALLGSGRSSPGSTHPGFRPSTTRSLPAQCDPWSIVSTRQDSSGHLANDPDLLPPMPIAPRCLSPINPSRRRGFPGTKSLRTNPLAVELQQALPPVWTDQSIESSG